MTDANLVLGRLAEGATLGGEVRLRRELAETAVERLAARLGLVPQEAALGIVRVADAEMARALRVMTVERGIDPRGLALVAFGGAGPMHACSLADELGMAAVLVPRASGVLSALGLALADLRRDRVSPLLAPLDGADQSKLERRFRALEADAAAGLDGARLERRADLRYRGQAFELTVPADDAAALGPRFHAAHAERYGYASEDEPVELVSLRAAAVVPSAAPDLDERGGEPAAGRGRRRAHVGGEWRDVPVLGGPAAVTGPAIVELEGATCVVPPGWGGDVGPTGTLVLERR